MHTDAFHVTARVFSRTLFLSSSCECCKSCVCGWVRISIWSSRINLHNGFCGWDGDRKERVVEEGDTLEMRWGAAWRHGWRLVLMNWSLNWLRCPSRVFYFIIFYFLQAWRNTTKSVTFAWNRCCSTPPVLCLIRLSVYLFSLTL